MGGFAFLVLVPVIIISTKEDIRNRLNIIHYENIKDMFKKNLSSFKNFLLVVEGGMILYIRFWSGELYFE